MKEIVLNTGDVCIVDDDDYATLSRWKWQRTDWGGANRSAYVKVAERTTPGTHRCILMHRQIMGEPKGLVVAHINGNPLDNRKENLEIRTRLDHVRVYEPWHEAAAARWGRKGEQLTETL